jgi:hypothetical protein
MNKFAKLFEYAVDATIILIAVFFVSQYIISGNKFRFVSAEVVRVDGKLYLKLHRVIKSTQPGEFYVSIYNQKTSCTAAKPHDLIEAEKRTPFLTRFILRLPKSCRLLLVPNHKYDVDVTYKINKRVYTKTIHNVELKPGDLK